MVGTQPTVGVKGSKPVIPRFKSAKEQIPVLSEKYLRLRNRAMSHKAMEAEWNLAVRRGQLIEKSLVERQASFLLISLRQKLLNFPAAYARRILKEVFLMIRARIGFSVQVRDCP